MSQIDLCLQPLTRMAAEYTPLLSARRQKAHWKLEVRVSSRCVDRELGVFFVFHAAAISGFFLPQSHHDNLGLLPKPHLAVGFE